MDRRAGGGGKDAEKATGGAGPVTHLAVHPNENAVHLGAEHLVLIGYCNRGEVVFSPVVNALNVSIYDRHSPLESSESRTLRWRTRTNHYARWRLLSEERPAQPIWLGWVHDRPHTPAAALRIVEPGNRLVLCDPQDLIQLERRHPIG